MPQSTLWVWRPLSQAKPGNLVELTEILCCTQRRCLLWGVSARGILSNPKNRCRPHCRPKPAIWPARRFTGANAEKTLYWYYVEKEIGLTGEIVGCFKNRGFCETILWRGALSGWSLRIPNLVRKEARQPTDERRCEGCDRHPRGRSLRGAAGSASRFRGVLKTRSDGKPGEV